MKSGYANQNVSNSTVAGDAHQVAPPSLSASLSTMQASPVRVDIPGGSSNNRAIATLDQLAETILNHPAESLDQQQEQIRAYVATLQRYLGQHESADEKLKQFEQNVAALVESLITQAVGQVRQVTQPLNQQLDKLRDVRGRLAVDVKRMHDRAGSITQKTEASITAASEAAGHVVYQHEEKLNAIIAKADTQSQDATRKLRNRLADSVKQGRHTLHKACTQATQRVRMICETALAGLDEESQARAESLVAATQQAIDLALPTLHEKSQNQLDALIEQSEAELAVIEAGTRERFAQLTTECRQSVEQDIAPLADKVVEFQNWIDECLTASSEELASRSETMRSKLAEVTRELENRIARTEARITEQTDSVESETSARLNDIEQSIEKKTAACVDKLASASKQLRASADSLLHENAAKVDAHIETQKRDSAKALDDAEKHVKAKADKVTEQARQLADQTRQSVNQITSEVTHDVHQQSAELQSRSEQVLTQVRQQFDKAVADFGIQADERIDSLSQSYEGDLGQVQASLDQQIRDLKSAMQRSITEAYEALSENQSAIEGDLQSRLNKVCQNLSQMRQQAEALKTQIETHVSQAELSEEEAGKRLRSLRTQLVDRIESFDNDMAARFDQQLKQISDYQKQLDTKAEECETVATTRLTELQKAWESRHQQVLGEITKRCEEQFASHLASMQASHTEQLAQQKRLYEQQIEELNKAQEDRLNDIRESQSEKLQQAIELWDKKNQAVTARLDDITQQVDQKIARQLHEAEARVAGSLQDWRQRLAAAADHADQQGRETSAQINDRIDQTLAQARQTAQQRIDATLEQITTKASDELESIRAQLLKRLDQVAPQAHQTASDLDDEVSRKLDHFEQRAGHAVATFEDRLAGSIDKVMQKAYAKARRQQYGLIQHTQKLIDSSAENLQKQLGDAPARPTPAQAKPNMPPRPEKSSIPYTQLLPKAAELAEREQPTPPEPKQ